MGLFSSFRLSARPAVIEVDLATGRFAGAADAIRATSTVEGASAAMVQFGYEPKVALAALTRDTRTVRSLPANLGKDSAFWVDAFKANPLLAMLAMPETQPAFVRKIMVAKPTTAAEQAVSGQVGSLRKDLGRFSDLKPTDFHDLATLQAAVQARKPFFSRWASFFG